jgi:hypothetical protein
MQKRGRRSPWFKLKKQGRVEEGDELLPERAAAVLWMFTASASGMGDYDVAAKIPKRFQKSWSGGKWTERAVAKILTNRSLRDGNIIARELFDSVQEKRKKRARGRKGNYANVFAAVSRCECCEHSMKLRGDTVACINSKCPSRGVGWAYSGFEDSFYNVADEVISKRSISEAQTQADVKVVECELTLWRERQAAIQRQIEALKRESADIADRHIAPLEREMIRLQNQEMDYEPSEVINAPNVRRDENERYRVRAATAALIRDKIIDVLIAPNGTMPRFDDRVRQLKRTWRIEPKSFEQDFVDGIEYLKDRQFFLVRFVDGAELLAVPSKGNPRDIYCQWDYGSRRKVESGREHKEQLPPARVVAVMTPPANATEFSFSITSVPQNK